MNWLGELHVMNSSGEIYKNSEERRWIQKGACDDDGRRVGGKWSGEMREGKWPNFFVCVYMKRTKIWWIRSGGL